jgi:AcrR family transcriptional regulator
MTATRRPAPVKRRRAQRGDGEQLRAEIVAAAKALLAGTGRADDVSIRAVADAVGVTPPSIYLHFADKDALLNAVVVDVFAELDAAMVAAGESATSPLGRLREFGLAYVRFAVAHPEHYRIATMDPCLKADDGVDEVLASSAFTHFNATVVECIEAGIFVADDPLPITFDLWAAAHGIAALLVAKSYLPWGDPEVAADRVLCAAALGHAAAGLFEGQPTPDAVTAWLAEQKRPARRRPTA